MPTGIYKKLGWWTLNKWRFTTKGVAFMISRKLGYIKKSEVFNTEFFVCEKLEPGSWAVLTENKYIEKK